ncbi:MAG: cyclohexadienyl dehydrogenase [Candidatus Pelagibacter sp.]|nr:cyclohexadienyl dehydrogenase [Candidatus Pelagibacter sp.]OUW23255.1 MAG: cyclohexadienyl dehydrogenase [Rickettsiales bacterium TMED174]
MFKKITIIGCGLIGSSILRSLNNHKITDKISVFDKSKDVQSFLKKEKLSDNISNDLVKSVRGADLVIISSPLSSYKEILLSIKDHLDADTILSDTGSVKKEVDKIVFNLGMKDVSWIGSHPIAGTEQSGPSAGDKDLFKERWSILSPPKTHNKEHLSRLKFFWESLGCKVKVMSSEEHDQILSLTSHLPHAIAYNLVVTAFKDNESFREEIIKYSAGGLRDFTRIASSDPLMWKDIFIDNSDNILKVLDSFSKNIEEFKKAVAEKNSEKLLKIFSSTKNIRKEIIQAGQDIDKPDFGRKNIK